MIIQAATESLGVAVGCPSTIAGEIDRGTLVPLFDRDGEIAMRYSLITVRNAWSRTEVLDFRAWILQDAAAAAAAVAAADAEAD